MKKTAIVTGGSRGIGRSIAFRLGSDGCNVVVFSRSATKFDYADFKKAGIDLLPVDGDISNRDDRKKLLDATLEKFGRVDILVNDAGVAPKVRADILEMTEESYDRVMTINTKGNMFMTQLVANQMIKQKQIFSRKGTIVNISSCSAVVSSPSRAEYCISKAGISMLTTVYADRLAKEGILVHEVRPGVIATDMTKVVTEKYDKMFVDGVFPIARWGQPEDVAYVVSFMCSEGFSYTTGDYVDVDGGFHIKSL